MAAPSCRHRARRAPRAGKRTAARGRRGHQRHPSPPGAVVRDAQRYRLAPTINTVAAGTMRGPSPAVGRPGPRGRAADSRAVRGSADARWAPLPSRPMAAPVTALFVVWSEPRVAPATRWCSASVERAASSACSSRQRGSKATAPAARRGRGGRRRSAPPAAERTSVAGRPHLGVPIGRAHLGDVRVLPLAPRRSTRARLAALRAPARTQRRKALVSRGSPRLRQPAVGESLPRGGHEPGGQPPTGAAPTCPGGRRRPAPCRPLRPGYRSANMRARTGRRTTARPARTGRRRGGRQQRVQLRGDSLGVARAAGRRRSRRCRRGRRRKRGWWRQPAGWTLAQSADMFARPDSNTTVGLPVPAQEMCSRCPPTSTSRPGGG